MSDLSDQDLRRSGRSTRRASLTEQYSNYAEDRDDYEDNSDRDKYRDSMATPPPNTPKKRRTSVDEKGGRSQQSLESVFISDAEHEHQHEHVNDTKFASRINQSNPITSNMTKEEFLKDLYSFMQSRGHPITKVPSLGYQELDLYLLFDLVIARGGMDEVTRKQEWKLVYQDLGIPTMSTSASYNTRTNYKKYLYIYELEHCDFPDRNKPKDTNQKFQIGQFIRIVSSVFEGQVFYAKILKYRYRDGKNQYYVHYNGWNSSHDEWMREEVLDPLLATELRSPEHLQNPAPSRSSKSNHLIFDASVSEKVITNLISSQQKEPKSPKTNYGQPLSPASPAATKKINKKVNASSSYASSSNNNTSNSEEEEAANELLEMEELYSAVGSRNIESATPSAASVRRPAQQRPAEIIHFPMRSDPGENIAKILTEKRNRPHEQDLIHRNRLHTHVLIGNLNDSDAKERDIIANLLGSIKSKVLQVDAPVIPVIQNKSPSSSSLKKSSSREVLEDSRSLKDIQEGLVNLQSSLLAINSEYKNTMRVLKKHHGVDTLPPPPKLPLKKSIITTRRSERT